MIVSSATTGSAFFLDGLADIEARQLRTQRQLSSGFKLQDAADSPLNTPVLIRLAGSLNSATGWQTSLKGLAAESQAGDQAIGTALDAITSARTLAARGATATSTASERQTLASQIQALQQELVSVANASFGNRFIFGGDQDQTAPYSLDPASVTGVSKVTAQASTRVIYNPTGQVVYRPLTAEQIFDQTAADGTPAATNAFAALQNLATALQANDVTGINNSFDALSQTATWLTQQQSYYGLAGKRFDSETQTTAANTLSLQTQISAIRDTDIAQAATDLTLENTALQAALGAQGQISRKSLFDYLG